MANPSKATFQEALETVESLPDSQQEDLINIVQRRRTDRRREEIVKHVKEGREAFARGEVRSGSAADLMNELDE